jgi:hypothetical protein
MLNVGVDDMHNTPLLSLCVETLQRQKLHCEQIETQNENVAMEDDAVVVASAIHRLQQEIRLDSAEDHRNDGSHS